MKLSVVICTYSSKMLDAFREASDSILNQTYDDIELIVVVDGNDALYDRIVAAYGDTEAVTVHLNEENVGLSASRNNALAHVTGDVVAFVDDDAVAERDWAETLVGTYKKQDVEAVGGKMVPLWVSGKPSFLPEEFYWLVGVTHRGFPEEGPVRNTFGSNISFRTEVLETLGGFDEQLGRKADKHVQGEETEIAERLRSDLGGTLYYTPEARIGHKVFAYRTRFLWLVRRAFWQGNSKRVMQRLMDDSIEDEAAFLTRLVSEFVPSRCKALLRSPSLAGVLQLIAIGVFTAAVGSGYVYGGVREFIQHH